MVAWPVAFEDSPFATKDEWEAYDALPQEQRGAVLTKAIALRLQAGGLDDAGKVGEWCKQLGNLTAARCSDAASVPPRADLIIFKAAVPPGSGWRYLSNFAGRNFEVDVSNAYLRVVGTFGCVESLYQGLKFNLVEQFARGGKLDGEEAVRVLETIKPGIAAKYEKKQGEGPADGFVALNVSLLWGDKLAAVRASSPELATLDRSRPAAFTQIDSGLILLACQLLMFSQSAPARELLLSTSEQPLEEFSDRPEGEFWSRFRPEEEDAPPMGQNADGQNLMHCRMLLRASGSEHALACGTRLLDELGGVLTGKAVLSAYALAFYVDGAMPYAAILEQAAPIRG